MSVPQPYNLLIVALLSVLVSGMGYAKTPEERLQAFAEQTAQRPGLSAKHVVAVLSQSERQQAVIDAITSPAESLPWHRYRPIFLTDARIEKGVSFWRSYGALFARARSELRVNAAVIAAIIGVETEYGEHIGSYRVIDALRTLAFDYPPRGEFFQNELAEYLALATEEGFDPLRAKGSYAGAMGMPQFISSSYRAYAVDFNADGQRDLWDQPADVIGSVANYLAEHGWEAGAPIATPAQVEGDAWQQYMQPGMAMNTTVGALREAGVTLEADYPDDAEARLLRLQAEDGPAFWVVRQNFYVITRYNHSPLYAMAVHQLAQAITARRES